LVWFRQDLRLEDQPALTSATERGGVVVPVFIWAPAEDGPWAPGAASRWWLHHSLAALTDELGRLNSRLILRQGDSLTELRSLVRETGADAVYWCRRYDPAAAARDAKIKTALEKEGIAVRTFNGSLLFEPSDLRTKSGGPFRVFTPFWKACLSQPEPDPPLAAPLELRKPQPWPISCRLDELKLLPSIDWAKGLSQTWTPGSAGAQIVLSRFLEKALAQYDRDRDWPAVMGTSRLSPYLHWGEISVREVWQVVGDVAYRGRNQRLRACAQAYQRELGWREFGYHLLVHFPRTPDRPLRPPRRRHSAR